MKSFEPRLALRPLLAFVVISAVHAAVGCASEEAPNIGNTDPNDASLGTGGIGYGGSPYATGGTTVTTSTGGTTGTGGTTTSTGGAAEAGCSPPATPLDTSIFKPCTIDAMCTDAVCVGMTVILATGTPQATVDLLADCPVPDGGEVEKCVPKLFVETLGDFTAETCTSLDGAEGRCMSKCIPLVSAQASFLPQAGCASGELCAPCYDPRNGTETGACGQGCDPGATQPPVTFASCCSNNGLCVPTTAVPAAQLAQLGTDTCTQADHVCAPTKFIDLTYKPKTCSSINGYEGRCIPDCLPAVVGRASFLPKADCDTGELCAPCYDPVNGDDTQACRQNGDSPQSDAGAQLFSTCCSDRGVCVPTTALSTEQQNLLGKDTCSASGDLCAPKIFADPKTQPVTCNALTTIGLTAEGRCVPDCVPAVTTGYQAQYLDQSTCDANYKCAPCYDPITGALTGACSQNGDSPKLPATTFPTCCSDGAGGFLGICVSTSLVPTNLQPQLNANTCTGSNVLCAPKKLTDPAVKPANCTTMSPLNLEGRCVPGCLPAVQSFASNLRKETCDTGELCAPCYNPIDGTSTGACTVNGDQPVNASFQFASCGSGQGLCVPSALVPANLLTAVPQDTCGTGLLCAPTDKVKDINFKYPTCVGGLGNGACVPKYLAWYAGGDPISQIAAQAFAACSALGVPNLPPGNDWLCAPCTNPLSGQATGACL